MGWHSIKRDPADIDFSRWLRLRKKKCEKCGRRGTGIDGITGLEASHFHGRAKWTTRFDVDNVDVLCTSDHMYFTSHKTEYEEWKLKKLGRRKYNILELESNTTGKKDFKLQRLIWSKMLKDLKEQLK